MKTSFPKKGQNSKQAKKQRQIKAVEGNMYEPADIGKIPPSERTFFKNNYSKVAKDRNNQGDLAAEVRTSTYMYGTYLRSK